MGEQKPSVGRIVHYVSYGTPNGEYKSEHRAAIITLVDSKQNKEIQDSIKVDTPDATGIGWVVDLCIINPEGILFKRGVVQHEDEHIGGTWHWPERV